MIQMTTGKITVKSEVKKTATKGFSDLKVGDSIEISNRFNGSYNSSPRATVRNCQTEKVVKKYFHEVASALKCFEWEGTVNDS